MLCMLKSFPTSYAIHSEIKVGAPHEKVPYGLSRCHTKRRMALHGRTHPSFGMTLTFPKKKKNLKSRCHTKRRMDVAMRTHPSFGMTMTHSQAIRNFFCVTLPR